VRLSMMGTRGVPARYGGFETCVEEVGSRLADRGHDVTVYCRRPEGASGPDPVEHKGMRLVTLPALRRRSLETLSHSALSVAHVLGRGTDAALVFNAANAPLLPALRARGVPVATHVDGLEWQRAKWGGVGREYYRRAESLAVRWSDALIADAQGISDYYAAEFAAPTTLISYGAPLVDERKPDLLVPLGLRPQGYHLVVARFEPENNVETAVRGYVSSSSLLPLVVVGSAPYADEYTAAVHAAADERVRFLGGVWDQELLDQLYANACSYVHGHSVGGTNPSLLRAIGASAAVDAFDVSFNREVLAETGRYWTTPADVRALVESSERDAEGTVLRGKAAGVRAELYDWDLVTDGYEDLAQRLATTRKGARRSQV